MYAAGLFSLPEFDFHFTKHVIDNIFEYINHILDRILQVPQMIDSLPPHRTTTPSFIEKEGLVQWQPQVVRLQCLPEC